MIKKTIYEKKYSTPFFFTHSKEFGGSKEDFHFHDKYEICLFLSDSGKVEISKNEYNLNFGDILLINKQDIHRYSIPPEILYDRYIVMFCPDYIKGVSTLSSNILSCFSKQDETTSHKISMKGYNDLFSVEEIIENLEEISNSLLIKDTFEREITTKICFSKFLLKLNLILKKEISPLNDNNENIKEGDSQKIEEMIKYINENLSEDLSLEALSKVFYMNKYYLSHYFKKNLGVPIGKYITEKKIEVSKKLILKGLDIYKVMDESGFNSYNHFLKTFKKYTGMTTREFYNKKTTPN